MGSSTSTAEALRKVYALLKVTNLWKQKLPSSPVNHIELDSIIPMGEEHHRLCQHLVGIAEWMV